MFSGTVIHIFRKNTVAFCRVVYKNMCDSTNQLSVLNNGTPAHPLNNSASFFQEYRISNADNHIFGGIVLAKGNLVDNNIKKLRCVAGDCG